MFLIDLEKVYEKEFDSNCNELKPLIERGIRKVVCRHCEEAACVESCPQDALKKIDGDLKRATFLCTGCKTCLMACPFGVNIDEIVEYKTTSLHCEELSSEDMKKCPYVEEGTFEESEEVFQIEENVFVKAVGWRKQIGV
jgi:Fe-S-cluster-containing hydrogenase component 2